MVGAFPEHVWSESAGVIRAATGLPVAPFNGVWCLGDEVSAEEALAAVDELAAGDLPWNVQLRPGHPAGLEEALAARGLVHTEDIPLMVLAPDRLVQRTTDLAFRRAVTFDDASTHLDFLESAFAMPTSVTRRGFPISVFSLPGATTWLGAADGDDVTTAYQLDVEGASGIFNVATPENRRGRGYGGAVTARAAAAAFASGAECVFLHSSAMGESVYRGIGFELVEHWRQWVPAEYAS